MAIFTGTQLNNILIGDIGNDLLDGLAGADLMIGGDGNDIYIVEQSGDQVYEQAAQGHDTVYSSVSYRLVNNVEDLKLSGISGIAGTGNTLDNTITGNAGDNLLYGLAGNDTLDGGLGNDRLVGSLGNDALRGGAGQDVAVYTGTLAGYRLGLIDGNWSVVDIDTLKLNEGSDTLEAVEQIVFSDATLKITQPYAEFQVSPLAGLFQNVDYPSIAALADGGFVVSWTFSGIFLAGGDIYAQRYDAQGKAAGSIFQVNHGIPETNTSITALAGGGFLVSWQDSGDGDNYGVFAQRYDANGVALGTEFQVNTFTTDYQGSPSITALANGGFVVSWMSTGQDGSGDGIYAKSYDTYGTAGGEFRVNTVTAANQNFPSIAALADGSFVVSWMSAGQDGGGTGIYALHSAGGGEFQVNTSTAGDQSYPSIAALADGGFVVSWNGEGGSGSGVYAQRYATDGTTVGAEFRVNPSMAGGGFPGITALPDGGFVVTWTGGGGIYAQRFAADGATVGAEFQVNTSTGNGSLFTGIAALTDGGFVATWTDLAGVYAQRYAADGTVVTIEGDAGHNTLSFTGGSARLEGGKGNDIYIVDAGDVVVEAFNSGTDTVKSSASFTLSSNVEHLTLTGSAHIDARGNELANTLTGNSGNNLLDGGLGIDRLTGGLGNDTYVVDTRSDRVTEGKNAGTDTVVSSVSYTLGSYVENLELVGIANLTGTGNTLANSIVGGYGNDSLNGSSGNDTLNGNYGNDILNGSTGNDTLDGNLGSDALTGGTGLDSFVFSTALGGGNVDAIKDFKASDDTIVLDDDVFGIAQGALFSGSFVIGFNAADADDYIIYNSGTGQLFYDADASGAGAAVQFATLKVGTVLTAADFSVVD